MTRMIIAGLMLGLAAPAPAAMPAAKMQLWRLDCGAVQVRDFDVFSDTYLYVGKPKALTDSCYLVRHGDQYLLWDSGLAGSLVGKSVTEWVFTFSLKERIVDQLARIGVKPAQVNYVGISHYHDDHIGQAADFPGATLLMGAGDWEAVKARPQTAARFKPWIDGGAKVDPVAGDKDVFGDGSVVVLGMPGHTPGHTALLVRLASGPVLLTGDTYHATEQVKNRGVPSFNTNRADTLASMDRFDRIATNLNAKVIIQHEPADVAKLPTFPKAAE